MEATFTPTSQVSPADALVARLRPRTVGEVIDQAFRLYRRHFLAMLAIVAVGSVPITLFIELFSALVLPGGVSASLYGADATTTLQQVLMYVPGAALVIAMLAGLTGAEVSFKEAYRRLRRILPRVLGLLAVQLALWLVVYFPIVILPLLSGNVDGGSFRLSGSASALSALSGCLLLPYLIVSIRLYLVLPALVAEDLGPLQAIWRSWRLTHNYWWRTWALSFVVGLLSAMLAGLPEIVIVVLIESIFHPDPTVLATITSGLSAAFVTLFVPVELLATALYYIDQRVRKEGLDLETAIARRYPPVASYAYAPVAYATLDTETSARAETPRLPGDIYRMKAEGQSQ